MNYLKKIRKSSATIIDDFKNKNLEFKKNINPLYGKYLYNFAKISNLFWMLLIFPVLILTLGAILMNTNTSVYYNLSGINENTSIVSDTKVLAGETKVIATTNVIDITENKTASSITENIFIPNSVGLSNNKNIKQLHGVEITGNLQLTSNDQEVIITENAKENLSNGEVSIYAIPVVINETAIDYTSYNIVVENTTDFTYDLNLATTNDNLLIESINDSTQYDSIWTPLQMDENWINFPISSGAIWGTIGAWTGIWFILLITKKYFTPWSAYEIPTKTISKKEEN